MTDILLQIGATKLALGVALAGLVWLATRRVARPAIAHSMWLLVLGAMLVPAVVPLRVLPGEAGLGVVAQPAVVSQPAVVPFKVPPGEAVVGEAAQSEGGPPVAVTDAGVMGDGMAPDGWLKENGKPLAVLLWLLGSAGLFGWTVVRTVRFQRTLTSVARPAPQLQRLATEIGETLGLQRVPRVYTTGARLRPLVWWAGGRIRVVIPSMFLAELDETELRAVLAHELAHVWRRDYVVRVLELLACSAYWWNPVVWWARRRMRSAEESSCDILAVSASSLTRDRYARSLLRVVEVMSAVPIPRAPALASAADVGRDSRLLEKRLRAVLGTAQGSPAPRWLRAFRRAALAGGLSLGLVYCSTGGQPGFEQPGLPTPAMSEDSAGVRIVEYAGQPHIRAPFGLSAEPRYIHGNNPGTYPFRFVHAGALFADGTAVVSDAINNELIVLSQDGTTHEVLASEGNGPGDVSLVQSLFAVGRDSVLVADINLGRLTVFSGGAFARMVDIRRFRGLGVKGIGAPGQLLMATNAHRPGFAEDWLPGHMARLDMETGILDTIASYDHISRPPPELRWSPIGGIGRVTVAAGQFVYARSDRPELTWRLPDGTVTQIVRWQAEAAPLTEELLVGVEAGLLARHQMANPGASDADIERMTADAMAVYMASLGGAKPLFSSPFADAEGRVWLPAYRPGGSRAHIPDYTVVSGEGEWLGTVEAPPGLRILDVAGGLVLGSLRDEMDVERVVVYELTRSG